MTNPKDPDVAALVARLRDAHCALTPSWALDYAVLDGIALTIEEAGTALSTLAVERDRQKQEADDLRKVLVDSLESDRQTNLAMDAAINPNGEKRDFIPAARELHASLLASEARATALEGEARRKKAATLGLVEGYSVIIRDLEAQLARAREVLVDREAVARHLEERAAYFDRTKGHYDRADAALSYRVTAKEVRLFPEPEALPSPAPADGRGDVKLREGWLKRDVGRAAERVKGWSEDDANEN